MSQDNIMEQYVRKRVRGGGQFLERGQRKLVELGKDRGLFATDTSSPQPSPARSFLVELGIVDENEIRGNHFRNY